MKKLPKYLSWSQLSAYEASPKQYYKQYILGEGVFESGALLFGRRLSEIMEKDEKAETKELELARILLPKYPEKEFKMKADCGVCKILSIFDGYDPENLRLGEYKTGFKEWTQKDVDTNGQLTFYAYNIYLNTGKLPSEIKLYWFDRKNLNLKTFKTERKMIDLIEMQVRIEKCWKGVKSLFNEFNSKNQSGI
ncbi:hypothetical protein [Persephonella sp.]